MVEAPAFDGTVASRSVRESRPFVPLEASDDASRGSVVREMLRDIETGRRVDWFERCFDYLETGSDVLVGAGLHCMDARRRERSAEPLILRLDRSVRGDVCRRSSKSLDLLKYVIAKVITGDVVLAELVEDDLSAVVGSLHE